MDKLYENISMEDGNTMQGERIGELVEYIINKFSLEKLSCAESKIVLNRTLDVIECHSIVNKSD